jgi:mitochondrial import receptor subunit TOM20
MFRSSQSVVAYAVYFDYKRRNDPEFRKSLKRESKRQARLQKEEAEQQGKAQKEEIKKAVRDAIDEGFPTDLEEREAFFTESIAKGEQLAQEGKRDVARCDAQLIQSQAQIQ